MGIKPDTRSKRIGAYHGLGNLAVVLLFALSWWMRSNDANRVPGGLEFTLSLLGFLLSFVTGWLGGELVYRPGMTAEKGANENAPNSLATETPTPTRSHPKAPDAGNRLVADQATNRAITHQMMRIISTKASPR